RWRQKPSAIKCCSRNTDEYYELLRVSVNSKPKEIKDAYRKLQKKYHPDIAGQKGHEYTLKLNEAYHVLMRKDMRREYDDTSLSGKSRDGFSELGYSAWKGPMRPQALFVDENLCIGCRECVHNARNTFTMDEALGSARVKVQFGDDDEKIQVSVDCCPVNCIHWVEREDLAVLEFLNRSQPVEAYGVFGGGWQRPSNVFKEAKFFQKLLKQRESEIYNKQKSGAVHEETQAQAYARATASMMVQREAFLGFWNWVKVKFGFKMESRE
ncbi:chaperone protein dnaJ C76, chloroplastic-like, partial [Papaver somniferum]